MYSNTVEVYHCERRIGEMEINPPRESGQEDETKKMKKREIMEDLKKGIRISHFSQPSERCPPLAVLHAVSTSGLCFKLEATFKSKSSSSAHDPVRLFHSSCLRDNKTAVMLLGEEELHLVAMCSRNSEKEYPCFWAFSVPPGLYNSCLIMLNLRCLGIVFDLDETLIVANTMRSFEDRIEGLQRRINNEVDPQRVAVMMAEVKRYQDDKSVLRQYVESDQVVDSGKVIKVQTEVVPALSDNHQPVVRPLIRLQEKNIILTRINPMIRDTSVLVRLRPAWEELRSYLTARGRKRFEVYVCTMAERDYALEMWRLLDPEGNLINTNELLDRIVCVKCGSRKSLFNVFLDGTCNPKMALVIDDRLKVWDDKDQPRVHVVPAFAPYYAPQAEATAIPVLCVARNVACNVRGGFFKDFDDGLLQKIGEISYENDIEDIPSPPDVSHYLVSEDDVSGSNGNRDPLSFDGMADAEVERRLKEAISASSSVPTGFPQPAPMVKPLVSAGSSEPSLQNSPAREEGEVPESELDPDTRRRLLILQHGQDSRDLAPSEPPLPQRPPVQVPPPHVQPRSGWFPVEEEIDPSLIGRTVPKEYLLDSEMVRVEKVRFCQPSFFSKIDTSTQSDRMLHENRRPPKESFHRDELLNSNNKAGSHAFYGEEASLSRSSSRNRDLDFVPGRPASTVETPAEVLHDIAMKCGTKVEFKPGLIATADLRFSVEAWFSGERVGEGIGRTRREALHKAAEVSIQNLADVYMSHRNPDPRPGNRGASTVVNGSSTFLGNGNMVENQPFTRDEYAPFSAMSDPRLEGSVRPMGSISVLRELCAMEGFEMAFHAQPPSSSPLDIVQKDALYAQVKIDGRVLGEGAGSTWDEARMQAAERALSSLRSMPGQSLHKRQGSPRLSHGMSSKRLKPEFQRSLQQMPSSGRYT
ncbi:PREDICTED: RNA polymerase II C-terminal domain phosphatase-like 1 isoform X2 [Tarenaya hassleriana]|uniref:RNA polymerase II C-terminal domain phosphatase-like 1 isoform X2 n=1 Tax=Tarenaya hassleriana TaxID=28532 RepID=UPI00053C9119|nr:PREDICTED: RNA polymerase II C-terminal domain phosphatase-like 1 isoform X2 [Tarenaya hassleriana]